MCTSLIVVHAVTHELPLADENGSDRLTGPAQISFLAQIRIQSTCLERTLFDIPNVIDKLSWIALMLLPKLN